MRARTGSMRRVHTTSPLPSGFSLTGVIPKLSLMGPRHICLATGQLRSAVAAIATFHRAASSLGSRSYAALLYSNEAGQSLQYL